MRYQSVASVPTTSLNPAALIGAAGLALGTAACGFCLLRPDRLNRFRRTHVVLIIFVFFSAAATSIGRFDARNASPLAGRYATASFLFWASALSLFLHEASHRPRWRRTAIPGIVCAVVILCAISVVPLHIAGGSRAVAAKHFLDEASLALVSGVRDERYLQSLYFPDTDELLSVVPMLRERRLSMFRPDWANYVGKELTSSFAVSEGDECLGQFDGVKPLSRSGESAVTDLRVSGWAWDQRAEKPCPLVLIVDDAGVIRGIARSGYPREDLLAHVDNKRIKDSGWVGFATCEKGCRLRAYAVSADESTAYRIGGVYAKR